MDPYDPELAPRAFGMNNTGVICYFNSFLQVLVGCTAFTRAVLANPEYLRRTPTGEAVLAFVEAYTSGAEVAPMSARVLGALVGDLARRRPHVRFGGGQESASEALVHLLDMMEPGGAKLGDAPLADSIQSPITSLFLHRYSQKMYCAVCSKRANRPEPVSDKLEYAVNFNLFHFTDQDLGREAAAAATAEARAEAMAAAFAKAIRQRREVIEGYHCLTCGGHVRALEVLNLILIPEIIFCMFNAYGHKTARYFPLTLELPAREGGRLRFRLVGQVEHSGSLGGGHYWARALRRDGVYLLNDTGVSPAAFGPSAATYIIVYHYEGTFA